ncbi:hypothetical protein HDU85_002604 [Gaertneriomyces sp. JEL0708]|nr:hypothetical protein HDU85_002604 [Gaertneriomyces sp. JEL0708]
MITTERRVSGAAATDVLLGKSKPALPKAQSQNEVSTPTRAERRTQFGIDCAELVHFTHWEPGGEHVKNLIVKNVCMKTLKIRYNLPKTRYFSMNFPETVTLSAGMSWTVPVTFRPVAKENYSDAIEFITTLGRFFVPVKATLPEHVLQICDSVQFGCCPVREVAKQEVLIQNAGELKSAFEWNLEGSIFKITPERGVVEVGESITSIVEFLPQDASVYHATAVLVFGDRSSINSWERSQISVPLRLSGVGKFSFLTGHPAVVDFGDIFVGRSVEKTVKITNAAVVPANFTVRDLGGEYFEWDRTDGTVAPGAEVEITIKYTPVASNLHSTEYYDITTVSGNNVRITCKGHAIGPKVTLNTTCVNFNDVPAGTTVTRALYIQNHSAISAYYQFLTDANSIFKFDKPYGAINPNSSVALTVKFTPKEPINYWRRMYCLVEHQDGLTLDLLGTCYDDRRRPASLIYKHIENWYARKEAGLWRYSPEQLEEMMKNGDIDCDDGVLTWSQAQEKSRNEMKLTVRDSTYDEYQVASEFFYENGPDEPVALLDSYVDFGSCSRYRVIEARTVRIHNRTKGKMSCVWVQGDEETDEPVFTVTPAVSDIPPNSTTEFRVAFRPNMDNSIYGSQLECFVYYKSMRNFRLVNEDTFTPPWCLTPMVTGNTFPPTQSFFIPKVSFNALRLDFPSCHVDKSVYRTVRVSNTGDTPVHFAMLDSVGEGVGGGTPLASMGGAAFSVKPRVGVLHRNENRLLVFRFSPGEERAYEQALRCAFNGSWDQAYDLHMKGAGYFPHLSFDSNNMLFFRPTCIGAIAKRTFEARNKSRITVKFEWRIPQQYASIIAVEPQRGVLWPNSSMKLTCSFAPNSVKNWLVKLPCYYLHEYRDEENEEHAPDFNPRRSTLSFFGRGIVGKLVCRPEILDLNAVLVHSAAEHEIALHNISDCDVTFDILIMRKSLDIEDGEEDAFVEVPNDVRLSEIEIVRASRVASARSQQNLRVKVCFTGQVQHEYRIYFKREVASLRGNSTDKTIDDVPNHQSLEELSPGPHYLCTIRGWGVHPLIQITDIRCDGFGKSHLWENFSIHTFNSLLASVETNSKPKNRNASPDRPLSAEFNGLPTVEFDFGSTPVGCRPTAYHLNLRNSGVVPVDWTFLFPSDLSISIERWADPGDYTDEQLHHTHILDNGIFTISPKAGRLEPGEATHVTMTYSHEFAGTHRLPVLFRLKNGFIEGEGSGGKEIVCQFWGYSVPPQKRWLHFRKGVHTFREVEIGTMQPPVQTYELINRGPLTVEYHIDLSPLDQLKAENGGVEILRCLRPKGTILPGQCACIEWIFQPLEAQEYEVDIPINVSDGPTKVITFRGRGITLAPEDGELLDSRDYVDPIPSVQEIDIPGQLARLSKERINLGHIPLNTSISHLLVITNLTSESTVSFRWHVPDFLAEEIKLHPPHTTLEPLASRVIKVTVASSSPRVYSIDVLCEVMDETALAIYNERKAILDAARREGRPLSVVGLDAPRRESRGSMYSMHDLTKVKYRPLPPISVATSPTDDQQLEDDVAQTEDEDKRPISAATAATDSSMNGYNPLPPAPEPFHLFLAITATSHLTDEFRKTFQNQERFFHEPVPALDLSKAPQRLQADAWELVQEAVESLLDDAFRDPEVQSAPQNSWRTAPIPYYAQISPTVRHGVALVEEGSDASAGVDDMQSLPERIIGSHEFQSLVEQTLEGTLFNLMQEANLDEFEMTRPVMTILEG